MLNPYDLGNFLVVENCHKIEINELIRKTGKVLKLRPLQSEMDISGVTVRFTTSKAEFNGKRVWFLCPNCKIRVGILYEHPLKEIIGCRRCLNLKYKKQRYKGMIKEII